MKLNLDLVCFDFRQLTSPELNYSIVRPLTKKLSKHNDGSMIYVLMVNR
jgi:hypothetical protein